MGPSRPNINNLMLFFRRVFVFHCGVDLQDVVAWKDMFLELRENLKMDVCQFKLVPILVGFKEFHREHTKN